MKYQERVHQTYQRLSRSNVVFGGLVGAATGALVWLLEWLVREVVIIPLFCNSPDSFTVCSSGGVYSWWIAAILATIASLFVLVRRGIFRPLLVVMAVLASLWGVWAWMGYLDWWQSLIWQMVLFGLGYALFTLLARVANFGLSLIAMVAAIVVVRLVGMLA